MQHYFGRHTQALQNSGIAFPPRFLSKGKVDPLHGFLLNASRAKPRTDSAANAQHRIAELFNQESISRILISNEMLLGNPFMPDSDQFFPAAQKAATKLQEMLSGYDVKVVYFIRDFASYIPSYYVQNIRRGGHQSLKRFVANINLTSLTWHTNIRILKEAFGNENVHVLDHGDLTTAPDKTVTSAFGPYFTRPMPAFDQASNYMNQSASSIATSTTRLANKFLAAVTHKEPFEIGNMTRNSLLKPISNITPNVKPKLEKNLATSLSAKFLTERTELL